MRVAVLGPLAIDGDTGVAGPRDRVVLAALATRRGEVLSAGQLADALWGEAPPATWSKVVQGCVARLRKSLGRQAIATVADGYRLTIPADEVDAARFERLVDRCRELLTLGEPDRAAYVVDEALGLWHGRAFADLDGWEAGEIEARRLEELRRDAEELRLDACLRAGRFREMLAEAQARVAAAPLRERRWALLALVQYQAGRQVEALGTLRQARAALSEQLGLDPGAELVELEQAILRQDASLAAQAALSEPSTTCPYLGLVPYDVDDADAFFGREADVAAALQRLSEIGVLAVVGTSGSGKSSLVRAGVAAALRRAGRRVVVVTPGARPLDALTALPETGPAPVLVVDQCEEAVTLCADAAERAAFFAALVEHAERAPLVVALRADRLGEVTAHPAFAALVERGLQLLTPMAEADLRAAVEGPARQAGLLLESGLVDLLVREVEGEPGALPLLSHALRQTWLAREGRTLTVAGYAAAGGIRGAVAQTAERLYEQTPPEQQPLVRDLLLRLVTPGPEGAPVRSRVPRRMLAGDAAHERIVELLVAARLVTSDADAVELAHEALARAWPRLQAWLDDDVEGQRTLRHLAGAADTWDAMGRPASELYRGVRLAKALDWRQRTTPDLNATERAFLDASQAQAHAEQQAAQRRRRTLVGVLAGAAVIASMLGALALIQARQATRDRDRALDAEARAEAETERAEGAAAVARARELVAAGVAALDTDPALAKLLALAAADAGGEPTVDNLALLHRAFAADPIIARYGWPGEDEALVLAADLHPDGTRMLASGGAAGPGSRLEVYDLEQDELIWAWPDDAVDNIGVVESRFTPDGEHVVAGTMWSPGPDADGEPPDGLAGVHVRDADTGELLRLIDVGRCGGWVEGASATHVSVVTIDEPDCDPWTAEAGAALLVDLESGEQQVLSTSMDLWAPMSGDGRFVAFTEGEPPRIVVVDVTTGQRVADIDPFVHGFGDADGAYWAVGPLNHDGSLLISGTRRVVVWDVATGQVVTTFAGHAGEAHWHAFSDDASSVYSVGRDGGLWQWDPLRGDLLAAFPAAGSGRVSIAEGGRLLVSDPSTRSATLLDVGSRGEVWSVPACDGTLAWTLGAAGGYAAFSEFCPDGMTTFVIDLAMREQVLTLPRHHAQHLALSPDGTRLVRQERHDEGDADMITPPRIRHLPSGRLVAELEGVCTWQRLGPNPASQPGCVPFPDLPAPLWAWKLMWSPDSAMVAVVRQLPFGPGVMVWDADTGELLRVADDCRAYAAAFTPDAGELLMACRDRLVAVSTRDWHEVRAADLVGTVEGLEALDFVGFSPDGAALMAVGQAAHEAGYASVHWIDPESLEPYHSIERAHEGAPKSHALSADGTLLATGSSDGFVKVWDVTDPRLVHEFSVGATQVQGLAFVDAFHLAVGTERGGISVYTLDPGELVEIVRGSLTRAFTTTECARFNFGQDCPSLAAARG